jgi:hypothetical protein
VSADHKVKNGVSATGGHMQVFRAVKSRFYVMESKRKPSITLGDIIKPTRQYAGPNNNFR